MIADNFYYYYYFTLNVMAGQRGAGNSLHSMQYYLVVQ